MRGHSSALCFVLILHFCFQKRKQNIHNSKVPESAVAQATLITLKTSPTYGLAQSTWTVDAGSLLVLKLVSIFYTDRLSKHLYVEKFIL